MKAKRLALILVLGFGAISSAVGVASAQPPPCSEHISLSPISLYGGQGAGLALDRHGNLFVAENVNAYITPSGPLVSKVTPQGVKTTVVPQGILGDVTALAVDGQGNLYVAD